MGNGDLNTAKANKEIFDKLVKNTEKEFRFAFKPSTVDKICDKFVTNSELLIQPIELSYDKHKKEIEEAKRIVKEITPIENILEDVTKRRDDLVRRLRKWSSKENLVYCRLFDRELQKLIDNKNYSLKGVDSLWSIYNKHGKEMTKELENDKTDFGKYLQRKLLKEYGLRVRKEQGNQLFEEKVQRLHNYLFK